MAANVERGKARVPKKDLQPQHFSVEAQERSMSSIYKAVSFTPWRMGIFRLDAPRASGAVVRHEDPDPSLTAVPRYRPSRPNAHPGQRSETDEPAVRRVSEACGPCRSAGADHVLYCRGAGGASHGAGEPGQRIGCGGVA